MFATNVPSAGFVQTGGGGIFGGGEGGGGLGAFLIGALLGGRGGLFGGHGGEGAGAAGAYAAQQAAHDTHCAVANSNTASTAQIANSTLLGITATKDSQSALGAAIRDASTLAQTTYLSDQLQQARTAITVSQITDNVRSITDNQTNKIDARMNELTINQTAIINASIQNGNNALMQGLTMLGTAIGQVGQTATATYAVAQDIDQNMVRVNKFAPVPVCPPCCDDRRGGGNFSDNVVVAIGNTVTTAISNALTGPLSALAGAMTAMAQAMPKVA